MISYSNQKEVMDLHDLARFLENEQKVQKKNVQTKPLPSFVEVLIWQQSASSTQKIQITFIER